MAYGLAVLFLACCHKGEQHAVALVNYVLHVDIEFHVVSSRLD